jgi:hypothetical protein
VELQEGPLSKRKNKKRQRQKKRTRRAMKQRRQSKARDSSPAPFGDFPLDASAPLPEGMPTLATLASAVMEMESLGDEPEFDGFPSALGEDLPRIVVEAMSETDDDIQRLEAEGDEEGIERLISDARLKALQKLVTPALKAEVRKRLTQLSRRLRREGQKQRADEINTLAQMLDFPAFPWPLFHPLTDAFSQTVEEIMTHLLLHGAITEAAGVSEEDLSPEQVAELSKDPLVMQRLRERYETDEDLRDMLDRRFDRFYHELTRALLEAHLSLGLFTPEELVLWNVLSDHRLAESGIDREGDRFPPEGIKIIAEALKEAVRLLNTPARQARWREHLTRLERNNPAAEIQALLTIFQGILADSGDPEELENWLFCAFAGEHQQLQDRLDADETLAEQVGAIYERILEQLEQGEPLLS